MPVFVPAFFERRQGRRRCNLKGRSTLVPGDIVRARPGDIIPADVKLLTGALTVDQSALTGESKDADKASGEVLSSGSVVRRGEGNGVVMLTGAKTYFV